MDHLENSLPVRILAARLTVRRTVHCNCQARSRVKYSGCSRKLTSWTLTTTGTEQPRGAVYWTCSRSGRSRRTCIARSKPSRRNGLAEIRRVRMLEEIDCAALSVDTYATNSEL